MNTTLFRRKRRRSWYLKQTASCINRNALLKTKWNTSAPKRSPEKAAPQSRCGPQGRGQLFPLCGAKQGTQRSSHGWAATGKPPKGLTRVLSPPHPLPARLYTPQHNPTQLLYPQPTKATHPPGLAHYAPARPQCPLDLTNVLPQHPLGPEVTHWPARPPRLVRSSHMVPERASAASSRKRGEATSCNLTDGCRAIFNEGTEISGSRHEPLALSHVVLAVTTGPTTLLYAGPAPSALTAPAAADGTATLVRETSDANRPPLHPRAARRSAAILSAGATLRPSLPAAAPGLRDFVGCI